VPTATRSRAGRYAARTVDERTSELTLEALECRDTGHQWKRLGKRGGYEITERFSNGRVRAMQRKLLCEHCRTERRDIYDGRGDLVRRRYVYPDGYLAKKGGQGQDRLVPTECRFALVQRLFPELSW
jgi:hypothetical protein